MLSKEKRIKLSNLAQPQWKKVISKYVDLSPNRKLNKKLALKDLKSIKKILDSNDLTFWIIGGTLLGIIRDNDWIPWDDDVDTAVYEEDFLPKYDVLKEEFILSGFIFRDCAKTMGTKINLYRYGQKNSIDCLFLNPDYGNNEYRLSRVRRHPRKYFEQYGEIEFKGTKFRIPYPPEKYLSCMYKNWKKPIRADRSQSEWRNKKIYWRK